MATGMCVCHNSVEGEVILDNYRNPHFLRTNGYENIKTSDRLQKHTNIRKTVHKFIRFSGTSRQASMESA